MSTFNLQFLKKSKYSELNVGTHTCNPSIWNVEVGGYPVQDPSGLHSELVASLVDIRGSCLKNIHRELAEWLKW
jgi:hypothetical protein